MRQNSRTCIFSCQNFSGVVPPDPVKREVSQVGDRGKGCGEKGKKRMTGYERGRKMRTMVKCFISTPGNYWQTEKLILPLAILLLYTKM
jgi:hypothetical protein